MTRAARPRSRINSSFEKKLSVLEIRYVNRVDGL